MAIAIWDDSYRTGNLTVDTQHQELFRMVNHLHNAIMGGTSKEILTPTLTELAKYTIDHFASEEALMVAANYPALAEHRRKHEDLTKQVKELAEKYRSGTVVLTITLSNFLADWLRHHIKKDDIALVKYLKDLPAQSSFPAATLIRSRSTVRQVTKVTRR
jgi:hemerythrin